MFIRTIVLVKRLETGEVLKENRRRAFFKITCVELPRAIASNYWLGPDILASLGAG